jgi:hypothetical protein
MSLESICAAEGEMLLVSPYADRKLIVLLYAPGVAMAHTWRIDQSHGDVKRFINSPVLSRIAQ